MPINGARIDTAITAKPHQYLLSIWSTALSTNLLLSDYGITVSRQILSNELKLCSEILIPPLAHNKACGLRNR
jgi:hypothetical protein